MVAFGRLSASDPRDAAYPLRALLAVAPPVSLPASRSWAAPVVYDQGDAPICVGAAFRAFLDARPVVNRGGPAPLTLYQEAQARDEFPGPPPPYDGTSVRAGAKAVSDRGYLSAYHWTLSEQEARAWVLGSGPLVLGLNWRRDMMTPDTRGFVSATGDVVGGHCILCCGFSAPRDAYRLHQSWGRSWGQSGRCWLRAADLATLLADGGEAVAGVEVRAG